MRRCAAAGANVVVADRREDDVKEVGTGYECGIGIEGYSDIQAGDVIEAYEVEETRPSLN